MINPSSNHAHSVTGLLDVPAETAFAFMADPIALGQWSLGCMNTRPVDQTKIHSGHSLFDGVQGFFEIDTDSDRLIVDYRLGSPDHMVPRVSARIVPAQVCGLGKDQCYLTLTAWRAADMDGARWHRLCAAHEAEIYLIKAQCEAIYSRA